MLARNAVWVALNTPINAITMNDNGLPVVDLALYSRPFSRIFPLVLSSAPVRILMRVALSARTLASVALSILANASLTGAKIVNGPGPFSVSTRPAAFTAATSVV